MLFTLSVNVMADWYQYLKVRVLDSFGSAERGFDEVVPVLFVFY